MTVRTKQIILERAKRLFATSGYDGFSIRILAKESGIGISSIYHFFKDKDELLKEIYTITNRQLGAARKELPQKDTAAEMLEQLIYFQFKHIEDVVFVLKYYLHYRPDFFKLQSGYLPAKTYLHIEEVLQLGVENCELSISQTDIYKESKVATHAINGFLLEYYPHPPEGKELSEVVESLHTFLMRSLTNKEMPMR